MEAHGRQSKWQPQPLIPSLLAPRCYKYSLYISQKALPCFYSNVPRYSAGGINDSGSESICGCSALTEQNTSVGALWENSVISAQRFPANTCTLSWSCEDVDVCVNPKHVFKSSSLDLKMFPWNTLLLTPQHECKNNNNTLKSPSTGSVTFVSCNNSVCCVHVNSGRRQTDNRYRR